MGKHYRACKQCGYQFTFKVKTHCFRCEAAFADSAGGGAGWKGEEVEKDGAARKGKPEGDQREPTAVERCLAIVDQAKAHGDADILEVAERKLAEARASKQASLPAAIRQKRAQEDVDRLTKRHAEKVEKHTAAEEALSQARSNLDEAKDAVTAAAKELQEAQSRLAKHAQESCEAANGGEVLPMLQPVPGEDTRLALQRAAAKLAVVRLRALERQAQEAPSEAGTDAAAMDDEPAGAARTEAEARAAAATAAAEEAESERAAAVRRAAAAEFAAKAAAEEQRKLQERMAVDAAEAKAEAERRAADAERAAKLAWQEQQRLQAELDRAECATKRDACAEAVFTQEAWDAEFASAKEQGETISNLQAAQRLADKAAKRRRLEAPGTPSQADVLTQNYRAATSVPVVGHGQ